MADIVDVDDAREAVDTAMHDARVTAGWASADDLDLYTRGDAGAVVIPRDAWMELMVVLDELVEKSESAHTEYTSDDIDPELVASTYASVLEQIDNEIQRIYPQLKDDAIVVVDDD